MADIESGIFSTGLKPHTELQTHASLITGSILSRFMDIVRDGVGGVAIAGISETGLKVVDAGGGVINVKAGAAWDKFVQRIYLSGDDTASAIYTSTVEIATTIDLSTVYNIKLDVDNAGSVTIDCRGATPAATTLAEIINAINTAGFGTVAFNTNANGNFAGSGYLTIKSTTTGAGSEVELTAPASVDATYEILGLSESTYPHTFNGGGGYAIPDSGGVTTYKILIEHLSYRDTIGTFKAGYPTGSDDSYTQLHDSYVVTITTSAPVSTGSQHQLKLAEATNDTGVLTITDKREDILLRLLGSRDVDRTPPNAPTGVAVTTGFDQDHKNNDMTTEDDDITSGGDWLRSGWVKAAWNEVTDASGISEYRIGLHRLDNTDAVVGYEEYSIRFRDPSTNNIVCQWELHGLPVGVKYRVRVAAVDDSLSRNISAWSTGVDNVVGSVTPLVMTAVSFTAKDYGAEISWSAVTGAARYHIVYTKSAPDAAAPAEPDFGSGTHYSVKTERLVLRLEAEPGWQIKVKARAIDKGGQVSSNTTTTSGTAGGFTSKAKVLSFQGGSMRAITTGATGNARLIFNFDTEGAVVIKRITVLVKDLVSGPAKIRVYPSGAASNNLSVSVSADYTVSEQVFTTNNEFGQAKTFMIDGWDGSDSDPGFTVLNIVVYYQPI